jgi:hypothetical protein
MIELAEMFPDAYWSTLPHENSLNSMILNINDAHPLTLLPTDLRDNGKYPKAYMCRTYFRNDTFSRRFTFGYLFQYGILSAMGSGNISISCLPS